MTNIIVKARLLQASLAFLMLFGPVTLTAKNWVVENAFSLRWRTVDPDATSQDSGQLVQINKLSSNLSTIQLELTSNTYCELTLQDRKGNHIQSIEAEQKKKGKHLVLWKHTDVTAGTYLLTLTTEGGQEVIEVVLE